MTDKKNDTAGLWLKEAKSGLKYCTGYLTVTEPGVYTMALFNSDSVNPKAPKFNLKLGKLEGEELEKYLAWQEKLAQRKAEGESDDIAF